MASPQLENGYVKIANELMDALCRCEPGGSESQVLWVVLRKTYGWNKKCDKISISQLSESTGLARRTIIYALKNLEAKNMIIVHRVKTGGINDVNTISLQKNYEKWVVQEMDGSARKCKSYRTTIEKQKENYKKKKVSRVVQEMDGSARNGSEVVQENVNDEPFLAPTKDTITKDIKENIYLSSEKPDDRIEPSKFKQDKIPYQEIVDLFNEILPELPGVRFLSDARKKALKGRWHTEEITQHIEWWREYFEFIKESDFLMGRKKGSDWQCDFDWILKLNNFIKIREGKYVNR